MLMKHAVMSPVFKSASLRGIIFGVLMLFVGVFARGQEVGLRGFSIEEPHCFVQFGGDWFGNVDIDGSIGVRGYCFPGSETQRSLNELVDTVVINNIGDPLVQVRFSGGRFSHYVCAARLVELRLQSVEQTIESVSIKMKELLQEFSSCNTETALLVVSLLDELQEEFHAFLVELEVARDSGTYVGQEFFKRFCSFYKNRLHPFIEWVEARNFSYGHYWFSNVDINSTVGVSGYCFPGTRVRQGLNDLIDSVIRGNIEDSPVQVWFSGGRMRYYQDAAGLVSIRLQSVGYSIEQASSRIDGLLRLLRLRGISNQSLVVLLLTEFQNELDVHQRELDGVRPLAIGARQDFFERFCHFYAEMFHPFIEWVEEQDFDSDHFHDEFWTVNIVDAVHPETVIEPERYEAGPEAWAVLNERIQATLHGQYFDSLPYGLAQWELYSLRATFLIQELNRVQAPGYEEVVEWIEEELDGDLRFRVYFSEDRWTRPNRYVRDINDAFEDYVVWATQLGHMNVEFSDDDDELVEEGAHDGMLLMLGSPSPRAAFAVFMRVLAVVGFGACL